MAKKKTKISTGQWLRSLSGRESPRRAPLNAPREVVAEADAKPSKIDPTAASKDPIGWPPSKPDPTADTEPVKHPEPPKAAKHK